MQLSIPLSFDSFSSQLGAALSRIFELSSTASQQLNPKKKVQYSQYFTEQNVARTMARELSSENTVIGDHGAGAGILGATAICSFLKRNPGVAPRTLHAYELDEDLHNTYHECMSIIQELSSFDQMPDFNYSLKGDFLITCDKTLEARRETLNAAILNPPYKKLNQSSAVARYCKSKFCTTPNEYAAFIVLSIDMLKPGGELVAIVPRSFTSGAYFKSFRKWLRENGSIEWFHRYHSRSNVFRAENVLQENVLFRFRKGVSQTDLVRVSSSQDPAENNSFSLDVPFDLMFPNDPTGTIKIPSSVDEVQALTENQAASYSLKDCGVTVKTGAFEDFRNKGDLREKALSNELPIIYAQHIKENTSNIEWSPLETKPCFASPTPSVMKKTVKRGNYLLIKRISANDSAKKRCIATMALTDSDIPGDTWLIDNHIQVIGINSNLSTAQVQTLYKQLTSDRSDKVFRATSGTTQLNVSDILELRFDTLF